MTAQLPDSSCTAQTAVYAVTGQGAELGHRIARKLGGQLFVPERLATRFDASPMSGLMACVAQNFSRFQQHVFVTATGIAVRSIAPHLRSKQHDPAVVALDQRGQHCISLVSGHIGGANDLATKIASITGGQAVITTATDTERLPSLDSLALEHGTSIRNISAVKHVNGALLESRTVALSDPDNLLELRSPRAAAQPWAKLFRHVSQHEALNAQGPAVIVTVQALETPEQVLVLHPRTLVLGMGCRRGVPAADLLAHVHRVLDEHGLAEQSLLGMASITAKSDEEGLLECARTLRVPIHFYNQEQLSAVSVPNPSERVLERMGVPSVCEAAALILSQAPSLLVPKTKTSNSTLAVAQVPSLS